ncbi:ethanolamine ammonia-lyase reactivating factor EutA [Sporomusa acidovorans]|uniref:Reactivating factor for ethanolamine ammonia lyase n=1 Tax=Sporomusa acidovorans (strain ATCC 49682 / DSM 3132 / Mol) TaxID=1123286 RepID=A0ABZ3JBE0_SPOA4|nr:ethanolamine ammonia-lyase reactivating factor EutA [Sporomusa acidovorans]OZC21718.1 reactivating factor for ethanolamine ammonia lyase [Sporomusa acidovorans DSM 3132]SDD59183.1 ethanolamine utilization protein EutA [Sporomusa acidovorans]
MNDDSSYKIKSVGIDIGTTTTQMIVSDLTVRNISPGSLVPRLKITDKAVRYKSNIYFTPLKGDCLVDEEAIAKIISSEYQNAGIAPSDVDTGAVIITGETAKKENARRISQKIANLVGNFVVAAAGGNLESVIAGKGSGAAEYSRLNHCVVANIDIGGGTANIGIFGNGQVIDSCCINIGGRLLEFDKTTQTIAYVSKPMEKICRHLGLSLCPGTMIELSALHTLAERMAEVIRDHLVGKKTLLSQELLMTKSLRLDYPLAFIMASGGVADYIYHDIRADTLDDVIEFGDMGPLLGEKLRRIFHNSSFTLLKPKETIRATVIGAGAQTVDVSGSTIYVDNDILPLKNVPVIIPFIDTIPDTADSIGTAIKNAVGNYLEQGINECFAIGLTSQQYLSFRRIKEIAKAIVRVWNELTEYRQPIIVAIEQDYGKVLGQTLHLLCPKTEIICIDQLCVCDGDYIDIGKAIAGGTVVPVVIKTLVFETDQR